MPNLESLINTGVMGNLSTLYPELSPMLWTSIATGKRAWKHGIYGFTEPMPSGRGIRPITSLSRKTKAIWNILNQHGKKSIVVGWWPSHPAEPINGVMVSNQYQRAHAPIDKPWPIGPGVVFPGRLKKNLAALRWHPQSLVAGHILPFVPGAVKVDQDKDKRLESIARIICDCSSIQAAALAIMHHEPWDFTAVYFDAIDHFSHGFMRYHPPRLDWVMKDDYALYNQVVQSGYIYHDMMLGKLLAETDEKTTVMIISDHGFHCDHRRPRQLPNEPAGPAAEHRHHGIFVVKGPGIRQDQIIYGAGLLDICPTLLTLFGLPIGDDMDGKPLVEIFKMPPKLKTIPSWDAVSGVAGLHPYGTQMSPVDNQHMLNQLVELGYIEKPDDNIEKAVKNCVRELEYNLSRAYMDAGRHVAAIPILEKLYKKWPEEFRFGLLLVNCLKAVARLPEARAVLENVMASKKSLAIEASEKLKTFNETHKEKSFGDLTQKEQQEFMRLKSEATVSFASMEYLLGCLLYSENRLAEAVTHFRYAENKGFRQPQLYLMRGNAFLDLKTLDQADQAFERALKIDPGNPQAFLGVARVLLARKKNREAVEQVLTAIGLAYHFPMAHYILGVGLHRIGRISDAVKALEIAISQNPNFPQAFQRLAYIYKHRLKQEHKAKDFRRMSKEAAKRLKNLKAFDMDELQLEDPAKSGRLSAFVEAPEAASDQPDFDTVTSQLTSDTVIVVSGLPRSGTSLMMQMLKAGGLPLVIDDTRKSDASNLKGYYEDKRVKALAKDNYWLDQAKGKAVKIVAPLLSNLKPGLDYRIIFMERNSNEVVRSQSRMLAQSNKSGADISENRMAALFDQQVASIKKHLTKWRLSVLYINYQDCIFDAICVAQRVDRFLGGGLDVSAMSGAVRPELYRERCS